MPYHATRCSGPLEYSIYLSYIGFNTGSELQLSDHERTFLSNAVQKALVLKNPDPAEIAAAQLILSRLLGVLIRPRQNDLPAEVRLCVFSSAFTNTKANFSRKMVLTPSRSCPGRQTSKKLYCRSMSQLSRKQSKKPGWDFYASR